MKNISKLIDNTIIKQNNERVRSMAECSYDNNKNFQII